MTNCAWRINVVSRKTLCLTLITLISASVFAIGMAQTPGSVSGRITLEVLNYTDLTVANTASDQRKIWGDFAAANPDVVVNKIDLFNEPFHSKIEAYVASGNIPDVMLVWPSGRSISLHSQGLLKDLTPLINRDGLRDKFLPITWDISQIAGGRQTMIPLSITASHAFYTNLEVLNACGLKPAKTYSEMAAQVPVLRARGFECVVMANKSNWVMQSCLFSMVAGRFGGEGWHEKILGGQARFTDPDFVAALDFMKRIYADGVIAQSSLGMDYGDGPGLFTINRGAYYIDGDWRCGAFITDADSGRALISPERQSNILVGVFPDIEGAKLNKSSSVILGTGWAMSAAIPAGSAKEDAAWRLIKHLSSAEVLGLYVEHGGIATPTRTDINFNRMALEPIQIAVGRLGTTYNTGTAVIDGVFHSDIYNPINDSLFDIAMGIKTPWQVAADIQRVYDAAKAAGRF